MLPAAIYGWDGNVTLHREWWRTVTETTAPNLAVYDNVSLAGMFFRWFGPGELSARVAYGTGAILLGVAALVFFWRRGVPFPEGVEGALLLTLMPLLSPQGWDYVFLIATPAIVYLVNYLDLLPRPMRVITIVAVATIAFVVFDLLGRKAYSNSCASRSSASVSSSSLRRCRRSACERSPDMMRPGMIRGLGMTLATAALAASTMQPLQHPAPGIPLTLAEDRARRISDLRYDLHVTIPAEPSSPVIGRVSVTFVLKDATRPLVLDFAPRTGVRSLRAGTTTVSAGVRTRSPGDSGGGAARGPKTRSTSSSSPATRRSTATTNSSTRSSCRRAHT